MSIRLKPDGTVEADSVEELLEYQRSRPARLKISKPPRTDESPHAAGDPLPEAARKLVRVLIQSETSMNTADVAKALDVEPRGVGGSVTSLTSWGRRNGFNRKQLITKDRRPDAHGHIVRRIQLTDRFRKMLEKGEVPGMKLDT